MSDTSPAAALSTAPFTDAEKADIRRFCGYPVYGAGAGAFQGWRYFTAYGVLEYENNNLAPAEYANVRYYLSLLYPLESALPAMSANQNIASAGPYTQDPNELTKRRALYRMCRLELCGMLGVPAGPFLKASTGVSIVI